MAEGISARCPRPARPSSPFGPARAWTAARSGRSPTTARADDPPGRAACRASTLAPHGRRPLPRLNDGQEKRVQEPDSSSLPGTRDDTSLRSLLQSRVGAMEQFGGLRRHRSIQHVHLVQGSSRLVQATRPPLPPRPQALSELVRDHACLRHRRRFQLFWRKRHAGSRRRDREPSEHLEHSISAAGSVRMRAAPMVPSSSKSGARDSAARSAPTAGTRTPERLLRSAVLSADRTSRRGDGAALAPDSGPFAATI
jgi:hypothetical protein